MNLHQLLGRRDAEKKPLRVLLIGAGKFGSMFLSQVRRTPGLHLVAVADLSPQRAKDSLARVGWPAEQYAPLRLMVRAGTARHLSPMTRKPPSRVMQLKSSSTPPAVLQPASVTCWPAASTANTS